MSTTGMPWLIRFLSTTTRWCCSSSSSPGTGLIAILRAKDRSPNGAIRQSPLRSKPSNTRLAGTWCTPNPIASVLLWAAYAASSIVIGAETSDSGLGATCPTARSSGRSGGHRARSSGVAHPGNADHGVVVDATFFEPRLRKGRHRGNRALFAAAALAEITHGDVARSAGEQIHGPSRVTPCFGVARWSPAGRPATSPRHSPRARHVTPRGSSRSVPGPGSSIATRLVVLAALQGDLSGGGPSRCFGPGPDMSSVSGQGSR